MASTSLGINPKQSALLIQDGDWVIPNTKRIIGFGKGNDFFFLGCLLAHSSHSRKYFWNQLVCVEAIISRIIQGLLYLHDQSGSQALATHIGYTIIFMTIMMMKLIIHYSALLRFHWVIFTTLPWSPKTYLFCYI